MGFGVGRVGVGVGCGLVGDVMSVHFSSKTNLQQQEMIDSAMLKSSLKDDILHDSAYRNGMDAGWNFAMNNDSEGFNNAMLSLTKEISEGRKELELGL